MGKQRDRSTRWASTEYSFFVISILDSLGLLRKQSRCFPILGGLCYHRGENHLEKEVTVTMLILLIITTPEGGNGACSLCYRFCCLLPFCLF